VLNSIEQSVPLRFFEIKIWLTRRYIATGYVCFKKNIPYLHSDLVLKHYMIGRKINSVSKGQFLFLRIQHDKMDLVSQ